MNKSKAWSIVEQYMDNNPDAIRGLEMLRGGWGCKENNASLNNCSEMVSI